MRRKPLFYKKASLTRSIAVFLAVVGVLTLLFMPPSDTVATEDGATEDGATRDGAGRYAKCMTIARGEPERARKEAVAWASQGGGEAAEHCRAVALLGLGQYEQSAQTLEALSERIRETRPRLSIELLGQAANAWLIADKPLAAYAAQTRALKERPGDIDLLIERSIALASSAKYWEAVDDLNAALDQAPDHVDALIFRAAAYRRLDTLELAEADITRALGLAPGNADGLLERGIIRRLKGDVRGAQSDWMEVLRIAPRSPAAEFARLNIEKIAIKHSPIAPVRNNPKPPPRKPAP